MSDCSLHFLICPFVLLLSAHPGGDELGEGAGSAVIHVCVPLLSRVSLLNIKHYYILYIQSNTTVFVKHFTVQNK